jgi:hypothetical protein
MRFASATISSVRLFSRLEGLSGNARVDPGAKIAALQPFPTGPTSIRYPLYSNTVITSPIFTDGNSMRTVTCADRKGWALVVPDIWHAFTVRGRRSAEMRDPMRSWGEGIFVIQ